MKQTEQTLKQCERKLEQFKNRPHSENIELDRLNSKFEENIEEIIDSCKKIRQILFETEQAIS